MKTFFYIKKENSLNLLVWGKRQKHWKVRKTVYTFQVTHATEKYIGFKAWVSNLSKPEGTMSEYFDY